MLVCCLVSFHILWAILCPQAVVDSDWNPYLKVPQVRLPEEVAHDVEARRGLDGRLLAAAATAAQAGADGPQQAAEGGQAAALVDEIPHHVIPEED